VIEAQLPQPAEDTTRKMLIAQFERFRRRFGIPELDVPSLYTTVPGLPPESDHANIGIVDSQIGIDQQILMEIFDRYTREMIDLIEDQLRRLAQKHPTERVQYLVLSGGFCSSAYVQKRLRTHFEAGQGGAIPNASSMQITEAENLQVPKPTISHIT
jgi:hypothetical protein